MYRGILCVLGACFFWGMIFVIPLTIEGFSSIEVALGRYFFFGLFSLFLICIQGNKTWYRFPARIWLAAMGFAIVANILYYTSLIMGLRYSSPAVTTLISGCAPLTIALFSNFKNKVIGFKSLIYPSLAMGAGLILVNIPAFDDESHASWTEYLFGILCAFNALAIWTWYVNANAAFLKRHPEISMSEWTSVIGITTLFWVIVIGGALALFGEGEMSVEKFMTYSDELFDFICGTVLLAVLCSWMGFYLWNRATIYLSLPLAGQITIFETIFGLLFVHLYEQHLPIFVEIFGIALMLGGAVFAGYQNVKTLHPIIVQEEASLN
jgi:drug/metabolite transporter (DMT)-like permease